MLSKEVEVVLAVELDRFAPHPFEHAQGFGDVFFVGIGLHLVLLEVVIEAGVNPHDTAANEIVGVGVLAEERLFAWTAFDLGVQVVLNVVRETYLIIGIVHLF